MKYLDLVFLSNDLSQKLNREECTRSCSHREVLTMRQLKTVTGNDTFQLAYSNKKCKITGSKSVQTIKGNIHVTVKLLN